MAIRIAEHQRLAAGLDAQIELLQSISNRIVACFEKGRSLYVLGNGGSAADAQHIAAEFVGRFKHDRRALPAVALTTDSSILTAVSNDLGSEYCFSRQVEALVKSGDLVWALSVSGRSPNVLRAIEAARNIPVACIGFTGRGGQAMKDGCELCFVVDHESSDRVQEMHQLAYHLVCETVERRFLK